MRTRSFSEAQRNDAPSRPSTQHQSNWWGSSAQKSVRLWTARRPNPKSPTRRSNFWNRNSMATPSSSHLVKSNRAQWFIATARSSFVPHHSCGRRLVAGTTTIQIMSFRLRRHEAILPKMHNICANARRMNVQMAVGSVDMPLA